MGVRILNLHGHRVGIAAELAAQLIVQARADDLVISYRKLHRTPEFDGLAAWSLLTVDSGTTRTSVAVQCRAKSLTKASMDQFGGVPQVAETQESLDHLAK